MKINQEFLKTIFDYHIDGYLIWKVKYSRKVVIGKIAGYRCDKNRNRQVIGISGKLFIASRLIFMWHHGYMPLIVDHKDRNPINDRINNLRAASHEENSRNKTSRKTSTSNYLGVNYDKTRNKWLSRIRINGKTKNIGRFDKEIDAALAYDKMAKLYYKDFANLNLSI